MFSSNMSKSAYNSLNLDFSACIRFRRMLATNDDDSGIILLFHLVCLSFKQSQNFPSSSFISGVIPPCSVHLSLIFTGSDTRTEGPKIPFQQGRMNLNTGGLISFHLASISAIPFLYSLSFIAICSLISRRSSFPVSTQYFSKFSIDISISG